MAYLTLNKIGNNGVYVDLGVYNNQEVDGNKLESPIGFSALNVGKIKRYKINDFEGVMVVYDGREADKWKLTHDKTYKGTDFLIVDSVNDVEPESTEHLIELITSLL